MKKLTISLLALLTSILTNIPCSYGMSGNEPGDFGEPHTPPLLGQPGNREKRQHEKQEDTKELTEEQTPKKARITELPLPHLETKEERAHLDLSHSVSSSSTSEEYFEHPADQSLIETLSLELLEHILNQLPWHTRQHVIALTSQQLRKSARAFVKHATIPLQDITQENFLNSQNRFSYATSLTVYRTNQTDALTAEQIDLLARAFPNISTLNLKNTGITSDGVKDLSQPGIFTALKSLNLAYNQKFDDEALAVLPKASFAHTLESLNLSMANITPAGLQVLFQPGIFVALKSLDLSRIRVGVVGMQAFLKHLLLISSSLLISRVQA